MIAIFDGYLFLLCPFFGHRLGRVAQAHRRSDIMDDLFIYQAVVIYLLIIRMADDGVAEEVDRQIIKDSTVARINFF